MKKRKIRDEYLLFQNEFIELINWKLVSLLMARKNSWFASRLEISKKQKRIIYLWLVCINCTQTRALNVESIIFDKRNTRKEEAREPKAEEKK